MYKSSLISPYFENNKHNKREGSCIKRYASYFVFTCSINDDDNDNILIFFKINLFYLILFFIV